LQEVIGVLSSWYYLLSSCPDDIMHCCNMHAVTNSSRLFNIFEFTLLYNLFISLKLRPAMKRDGIELLDRRVPVGSKEIGERVQYSVDDVHHGQRSPKKAQANLSIPSLCRHMSCCAIPLKGVRIDDAGYAAE
jgi:hypothetical protein